MGLTLEDRFMPPTTPTLPDRLASLLASLDSAIAAADAAGDDETALRLVEARHLVHASGITRA